MHLQQCNIRIRDRKESRNIKRHLYDEIRLQAGGDIHRQKLKIHLDFDRGTWFKMPALATINNRLSSLTRAQTAEQYISKKQVLKMKLGLFKTRKLASDVNPIKKK